MIGMKRATMATVGQLYYKMNTFRKNVVFKELYGYFYPDNLDYHFLFPRLFLFQGS